MEWINWIESYKWKLLVLSLGLSFITAFTLAIIDALYDHVISNGLFNFLLEEQWKGWWILKWKV